ncbi:hypothetical protein NC653_040459 [Populus alba x Populus x berolinensis]|uniref:Uncharacterized protein n=1 Tax=Populus alba x Populus x berolinensis TaxID=444605 RepID=A0AAD6PNW3_9ROSI|nr:hypothetical protein NC653_040459 [Populus alba x Populus x berolinensis]
MIRDRHTTAISSQNIISVIFVLTLIITTFCSDFLVVFLKSSKIFTSF